MSLTGTLIVSAGRKGSGLTIPATCETVAGTEITINESIILNQTNAPVAAAFAVADLKLIVLVSDKNCTLETNDGGTPQDVIALKANRPLIWDSTAGYYDCPFSDDVTGFFITNTTACVIQAYILTS